MRNNPLMLSLLLFVFSVFISSISQILLKISANKIYPNRLKEYLNPWVITAYTIFLVSSLLTVIAYRKIPLSWGPLLESLNYLFVSALSYFLLKERLTKRQFLGLLFILGGLLVIALQ